MEAYQERVVAEKDELDEKIKKLSSFFETVIFHALPEKERNTLYRQYWVMRQYSAVLEERIEAWK